MMTVTDEFTSSNKFIEKQLDTKLCALADYMEADVLTIAAPMANPVDELVRYAVEDIKEKRDKLLVILETNGGSIEVVERMADLFRHHYPDHVSFLVPNYAMSAGTVFVMSGDAIYMDYFSVLGPIDPQVKSRTKGDVFIPAIGYIEKYQDFVKRSAQGKLTDIEVMFFVDKFDPAELHFFEQARDLSVDLLKKWLVNYKFKDWTVTETGQTPVTKAMKEKRASEIARKLNDVRKWKSHGRTLSKAVIENDLNLKIDDFGANKYLNDLVRPYYRLLQDYMQRVRHSLVNTYRQQLSGVLAMTDHPTMDALLKQNPKAAAEAERLERIREQVSELRKKGMRGKQFDLSSPFGGKLWLGRQKAGTGFLNDT